MTIINEANPTSIHRQQLHHPVVFVVDMVNGFCKEGPMADTNILNIVPNIQKLLQAIPEKDRVFIADTHATDAIEFKSFPPHCITGTTQSSIISEFDTFITSNTRIIEKNSTNTFIAMLDMKSDRFHPSLLMENYDEFIITGCCSDICVLQFALCLKTYLNHCNIDKPVIVPTDCIDTYDAPQHHANEYHIFAIKLMQQAGIVVVSSIV